MDRKRLVINADDLGFSADINAAIEELHRKGVLTSATLMVDGPQVEDAVAVARRNPGLGVGLHLDLCPVVGLYSLPYEEMRKGLSDPGMLANVAEEVDRQIRRFKSFGLEFSHMDSHRHFHALPELFEHVVSVAVRHGLKSLRLSKDWILPRTPSVYWTAEFFEDAKALLRSHGVIYPDTFVFGWNPYSAASFQPGLNELMVHVGYAEKEYQREYSLLAAPEFLKGLEAAGIERIRYADSVSHSVSQSV